MVKGLGVAAHPYCLLSACKAAQDPFAQSVNYEVHELGNEPGGDYGVEC